MAIQSWLDIHGGDCEFQSMVMSFRRRPNRKWRLRSPVCRG
jgi:hypothetical protein